MEVERAQRVAERRRRVRELWGEEPEHADRATLELVVRPQPRKPEQDEREHRVPGRRRMVVEVLLAADQPLAVDRRQEETAALVVAEELHRQQREPPRLLQPAQLPRRDVELVETMCDVGVVVEHPTVSRLATPPRAVEPAFGRERPEHELGTRARCVDEVAALQATAGLRQRRNGQPVPRGAPLVVAQRLRSLVALGEEPRTRLLVELAAKHEAPVLERLEQ